MIINNLAGGIGNQMFQYAMGKSLAQENDIPILYSDTFDQYDYNFPKIVDIFDLNIEFATDNQMTSLHSFMRYSFIRRASSKLCNILGRQLFPGCTYDLHNGYSPIELMEDRQLHYLHGTWQSESYFKDFKTEILKDFKFKQTRFLSEIDPSFKDSKVKIGVHIRRGDYISNPKAASKLGIQPLKYYIDNLSMFRRKFPSSKFYVFSDDIHWARSKLSSFFNEIYFCEGKKMNAASDLQMLSQCDHFVLSNSTFGWWGAYLSKNFNPTVIYPKVWFSDGSSMSGLIPKNWTKSMADLEANWASSKNYKG